MRGRSFSGLRAVTFDFWNTLMWEGPQGLVSRRLERWEAILEGEGVPVAVSRLRAAHDVAFDEYQAAWRANRQYRAGDAAATMLEHLGIAVGARVETTLVDAFTAAGLATPIEPCPGIQPCLRELKSAGLRLGVVCDIGLTPSPVLLRHLQWAGIHDLFDAFAFSDEVGVYKPDPAIFERALSGMGGIAPASSVHIGDRLRTDVEGARVAGMRSVRYTGIYDDDDQAWPEADAVIADLSQLPQVVERLASSAWSPR